MLMEPSKKSAGAKGRVGRKGWEEERDSRVGGRQHRRRAAGSGRHVGRGPRQARGGQAGQGKRMVGKYLQSQNGVRSLVKGTGWQQVKHRQKMAAVPAAAAPCTPLPYREPATHQL